MVKVVVSGQEYYMDGFLKSNLDYLAQDVRQDSDAVIVISGKERGGKSVLAMQVASYVDPSFDLSRIAFSPSEFKAAVLKAQKYECVVYDEAITGLRAQRWSSEVNQSLVEMLAQIGQKNLFIVVVIPSFFELGKYVAIHRSVGLIHVYRNNGKRGYFAAFNEDKKTRLYLLGKKEYNYYCVTANFVGRFTNFYALDEQAYRLRKLQALTAVANPSKSGEAESAARYKLQRDWLLSSLNEAEGFSLDRLRGLFGGCRERLSKSSIARIVRDFKKTSGGGGNDEKETKRAEA